MMTPSIFGENLFDEFFDSFLISLHLMTDPCRKRRESCMDVMRWI